MTQASSSRAAADWRSPQPPASKAASSSEAALPWWGRSWVAATGALAGLLLWNWALMVSLAIAIAVSISVYLHLTHQFRLTQNLRRLKWRSMWRRNRALWLSVLAGGGTLALLALGRAVWQEPSDPLWLTVALLVQGAGVWAAVGAIARGTKRSPNHTADPAANETLEAQQLYQLLADLSDPQPLKRLMAVRLLTHQSQRLIDQATATAQADPSPDLALGVSLDHVRQYFRLALQQESDPQIRMTLQNALDLLSGRTSTASTAHAKAHLTASKRPVVAMPAALSPGSPALRMRRRQRSLPTASATPQAAQVACPQAISHSS